LSRQSLSGSGTVVSHAPLDSTVVAEQFDSSIAQPEPVLSSQRPTPSEPIPAAAELDALATPSAAADKGPARPEQSKPAKAQGPGRVTPKGQAHDPEPSERAKPHNWLALVLVLMVVGAGAVFALRYLKSDTPRDTGKSAPPPPATIQEKAPPPTPPPADIQPQPSVDSLLLQAGKQFTSDPEQAQQLLLQALSMDPNNYDCSLSLARLLSYRKEYSAAIEQYQYSLRLDDRAAEVHHELGSLYLAQGDYDSAIQSFETALILEPRNKDEVLASLGFCHFKKGDFPQARLLFQQSLDLNANNLMAKSFLASLPKPTTQPPSTEPPATTPPDLQPSTSQPPAPQPPATKTPAAEPPVVQPSKPAPKPHAAEAFAGRWNYTITIQSGQTLGGQIDIDAAGDRLKLVATSKYRMTGQDGSSHQFREKNYFFGAAHGQNLGARCDKAELIMDGRPIPVPGLPLMLSLELNPDGRSMHGHVSNSFGNTAPLSVKKR
jgi:tetratricopeptide (TPR) repeat protein